MRALVLILVLFQAALVLAATTAAALPPGAIKYLPELVKAWRNSWPDNKYPWFLAGTIEQETCISLKSKGCWNPNTELKTDREYGFGLGQLTVTKKFNGFEDTKKMSKELSSWKWDDRYNPYYQILGIIALEKVNYSKIRGAETELDKQAFMLSAYNGGLGGVLKDRKLCTTVPGCNSNLWFGNVELNSFKSKVKPKGYGQSFFDINRGYVHNIILIRSDKYKHEFSNFPGNS